MFLHPDIKPFNTRCSYVEILQAKTITSYIDYIKLVCDIYKKEGYKFELYKFKCENYELINNYFFSIFEYNDYKAITDLQIVVDKIDILYKKDYYFMIKNLHCEDLKANLCILPCFEIICNDSLEVKKEKLVKSIDNLKNYILMELNSHQLELDILKTCKPINSHEINFIKENGWLNDFFDQKINIDIILDFINELNYDDFMILTDNKSDFKV